MSDAQPPTRTDLDAWWRDAVIYQVYPRSFADSDGDGLGDLRGITSRLEHIASLGVDAVWISPFYPSPQVDAGYDVADYRDVAPEYGTLADFDALTQRAHELGLKVVIDLVPNHSSDQHAWFQAALTAAPGSPERARYLFRHSPDGPPNNWGSLFGGPAWEPVHPLTGREADRGWWYLHLFAAEQPDFDWTNPEVHEMFNDVLRYWVLEHGVDGFRVDVAHGLVKAEGLPDDEVGPDRWADGDDEGGGRPKAPDVGPMFDQPGVHDVYREWRGVLDAIRPDLLLVAEAWVQPPSHTAMYVRQDEMSQAFNFDFLKSPWDAYHLREVIETTTGHNDAVGAPTTWVLSNHDVVRHTSRFGYPPGTSTERGIGPGNPQPDEALGLERARALTLFALGLPGSAYLYQGEELGLPEHTTMADTARQDPTWLRTGQQVRGRDGCRVPLPWSADGPAYGFNSTGATWLPQPEGWGRFAPAEQDGVPGSTLEMYRAGLRLRRERGLGRGSTEWLEAPEGVLAVRNGRTVLVLNTGDEDVALPVEGSVLVGSSTPSGPQGVLAANSCLWLDV
ncbi:MULTISPECIES: glycoside hydrolase family 13 protein [unclassified Actinomyces]|uniref:glycoside hydrolase family 13 protein n=1 Tax=unclassified Actinomyces TaxID=2609248 RepID=UPI002017C403|nr:MULTISPECIES: glycoside hydrolase family 13 protein [unclassified Actinomyces]MCL3778294.1 glycoside hydrolase family 13 protein [Actinomyces sp. AC-20-1]MCL3788756.1 glycoside hydrolase family 13 protein [Actinomyces sp. 187325]MCL3791624.1 glycoside hydrolase family 13 protein [Actinomyces sp. 186855]MCL3794287.1 glycoside hydrolase family 13 protein [Actinomyces sp. 217892]